MVNQKHILITGTTGGIGFAIKEMLEKAGNYVTEVNHTEVDLSSYADVEKFEKKISDDGLRFDWLVLAHGFIDPETDFERQTYKNIDRTFAVNTLSNIYLTKLFLKHVRVGGGIIFISSTAGLYGNSIFPVYAASKGAINTFVKALTHGYKNHSFYSVCPGPTETAMWQKIRGTRNDAQSPLAVAKVIEDILHGVYTRGDIIIVRNGEVSLATSEV